MVRQILTIVTLTGLFLISCNDKKPATEAIESKKDTLIATSEPKKDSATITNLPAGNLDELKGLDGKYPEAVKLLENKNFTERLKKLVGNERYQFIIKKWGPETPIKIKDNILKVDACETHNCGATNFTIIVDFAKNEMFAGIREEEKITKYAESNGENKQLNDWAEDKNK